ncbi:MAG: bifunctional diaminohydroxyphosphoribosylaminopyrimidine deaminase/5-amino-6-(5-phosphoribosylamino)uracil reductase RibD [Thermodesulfobacteriota bacterium]
MNEEALAEKDEAFMDLACRLAARGRGHTKPNPMVGAVLVRRDKAFSTGYHRRPGTPHAEVVAIERAKEDVAGATLYVNLEPCAHHGRTPPCVDLILAKKIRRVVIGTKDTNPLVNGRSIAALRRKGVQVTYGVLEEKCRRLNETFFKHVETNKPFVTLKAALTLDGKIASSSGQSQWISCPASRQKVHKLRSIVDAILVGIETVLQDDPRLTVRGVRGAAKPCRVVLDSRLRVPMSARVLEGSAETLLATTDRAQRKKIRKLENKGIGVEVFRPDRSGRVPLGTLLRRLGERGMQHVLLEGGSGLYTTALKAGEVDKLLLFVAPLLLGGKDAPGLFDGIGFPSPKKGLPVQGLKWRRSDRDLMLEGYCSRPGPLGSGQIRKMRDRT